MTTEEHREPLSSEIKRLEGEVGPHAHHPLLHLPVFEQLKQRNVFRVAVLYVVVCWLILDPLHVIFHMAGVPEWVVTLSLVEEGRVGGTTFNLPVDGFDPALDEFRYIAPSTIRSAPLRVWEKPGEVCGRVSS